MHIYFFIIPLAFVGMIRGFILTMVAEKENKNKEMQKVNLFLLLLHLREIMGMTQFSYVAGWSITFFLKVVFVQYFLVVVTAQFSMELYFSFYAFRAGTSE